jgi:hypothetical protein
MNTLAPPRAFCLRQDVFAFPNETIWHHENGRTRWERAEKGAVGGEKYMRRCFVLTRSAAQFWRFAHFAPEQPRLPAAELALRIRAVVARPIWNAAHYPERVIIPGFANLREASAAEPDVFRANLGGWWQSYFRIGNWRIILPTGPRDQRAACSLLRHLFATDGPVVLWLINFPWLSINHAVLAARETDGAPGHFEVYDPNLPDKPQSLVFDEAFGQFNYPPTFYFRGGAVGVRPAYYKIWH